MKTIDIIGLAIGVVGLLIAIWQLHRTRTAAEAARDAAMQTVSSVRRLEAATKMHEVCSRSRELLRVLHGKSLAPAALAAFELRDAMARYGHDDQSQNIVRSEAWAQASTEAQEVHDRLETAALANRMTAEERATLVHVVARLHTEFSSFAAKATVSGIQYANT
jgi:hypothetical protein